MKRTTPELNYVWSCALRAVLMILPLGLSGCFDNHLPPAGNFGLAVSVSGSGQITSNPAGIDCGSDCTESLAAGSTIILSATPASGAMFTGWGGDCSGTTPSCTLTMNANRTVTASFTFTTDPPPPAQYTLTVSVTGTGSVSSTPAGISCGTDCTENYADGTSVTLTAMAGTGFQFSSWSGACSGTGSCVVAMSAARSVTAIFTADPPPVQSTLTVSKNGVGTVTSSTGTINCGSSCSVTVPIATPATSITLSASAGDGYTFAGWSGAGIACPGTGTCTVSMSANRNVLASFTNNTTQILFEERFDNPGPNLTYGFDGWLFGYSNQPWARDHLLTGGVNNGPNFRATSTFDSLGSINPPVPPSGASHYFRKDFTGNLANHSRDFWVRQCVKYSDGHLDSRPPPVGLGLPPENPKINYFIGDGGGFLTFTMTSGTFQARERVIGQSSGARADFFSPSFQGKVTNLVGTFQAGETLVGQTSGATATFVSFLERGRTVGLNHFWHPGGTEEWRGDGYLELTWYDNSTDHYFASNSPLNQVRHSNWLLLQDHYDEWMCLETHIDLDQVPWVVEIYVTTAPGAATLAAGTTALDTNGRRQFNDYLYIRYSNPDAPALEPGFGVDWNEYGAYGSARLNERLYFDEYLISTGKVGHPFR